MNQEMGEILFPFVYWAQDERNIFMRVDLRNVDTPEVSIREKRLIFQAVGEGAKGRNQYNFALDFFASIDPDDSVYKLTHRGIEFTLKKQERPQEQWWPRLTFNQQRYSWLKIDFEKWKDPEAEDSPVEEDPMERMKNFDMNNYEEQQAKEMYERMMRDMEKEGIPKGTPILSMAQMTKKYAAVAAQMRKTYLLTYNAAMFVGYLIILCQLVHGYSRDGTDYFKKAWADTSSKMICCQLAQFFEIFHSLVGYVKSPWTAPFLQVFGRGTVLFLVLTPEPRLHDKPFIFYLFFAWSLIEVFRYPYYFFAVLKMNIGLITWLRYTMWIPLYPLGFLCEAVIIIRAMIYYDESGKFSVSLPNSWNMSFDFGLFLRFYLAVCCLPGVIYLLQHMRKQRLAKLFPKKGAKKKTQ